MTTPIVQCFVCTRYGTDNGKCQAFPDGIPEKILFMEHDHREPYKGDNGIRFEPVKEPK